MKIAVVDSGIDQDHKIFKNCIYSGFGLSRNENGIVISDNIKDENGHGTAIAGIIHKALPEVELLIIKVFGQSLLTYEGVICQALEICIAQKVDIVNMSLGIVTQTPSDEMVTLLKQAYLSNIVIVSATNNAPNIECYPAFFPTVFGVTSANIKNRFVFGYMMNSAIEFAAKGSIQRVAWKDGESNITGGTSYACAHFTVIVANMLKENASYSINDLKSKLILSAASDVLPMHISNSLEFSTTGVLASEDELVGRRLFYRLNGNVEKLLLYPISDKEINTLLEFCSHGGFERSILIDYVKMGFAKKHSHENVSTKLPTDSEIRSIDTIVLGYFHDHPFEANVRFGLELIKLGIKHNRNFYVFDSRLHAKIIELSKDTVFSGQIFIPEVDKRLFDSIHKFRFLPALRTPVLAVIGTSNKQGKITTQLKVKEILQKQGYKVAHISTEPQGELLGACFSFPFGYKSTVQIKREEWSVFLRILLRMIQEFVKPDIILTGTQGGFIPRTAKTNLWGSELDGIEYIHGILPDAFACVINPEDDYKLILQATMCAEAFTKSNVLFYALNPLMRNYEKSEFEQTRLLNADEYENFRMTFSDQLGRDVFNIMETCNDSRIVQLIEDFYS